MEEYSQLGSQGTHMAGQLLRHWAPPCLSSLAGVPQSQYCC